MHLPERTKRTGYRDIAEALRHSIAEGSYAPGGALPAEGEIADHFGVARETGVSN
jgi:DNA-binding GntR family transcriptional regulator